MNAAAPSAASTVDVVDATGVSPRFAYHDMEHVVVVEDAAASASPRDRKQRLSLQHLSSRSSFKSERERRFACQFDPSLKNGRSLVRPCAHRVESVNVSAIAI